MRARGYDEGFARQVFQQILGFGEYGFPEVPCRELRAARLRLGLAQAARARRVLLRAPQQPADGLLRAGAARARRARARRRGAAPSMSTRARWNRTLETAGDGDAGAAPRPRPRARAGARGAPSASSRPAPRAASGACRSSRAALGLDAARACGARGRGRPRGLAGHRHRAGWEVLGVEAALPLLPVTAREEGLPLLPVADRGRGHRRGLPRLGLTLGRHPLALLRPRLEQDGWLTAAEVADLADGAPSRTRRDRRHAPAAGQRRRASSS